MNGRSTRPTGPAAARIALVAGLLGAGGLVVAGCGGARVGAAADGAFPGATASSSRSSAPLALVSAGTSLATAIAVTIPAQSPARWPAPRLTPLPAACLRAPVTRCLVTLTLADAGHLVRLRVGTRIRLVLEGSRALPWQRAASSDPLVLRPVPDPLMLAIPIGWVRTDFLVERPGQATIRAIQMPACAAAHPPCLAPDRLFAVTVLALR